ncbi:hypothetical protein Tco_1245591 [Tanacetum coccineum]
MASDGSDQDARYVLSKLLQRGAVAEYENIVLSWPSEEYPPVIKGSFDANEDIGVVEVSSAIDDVFDIGERNVESMEVRSEFSEFLKNKKSVEEVVVGGGKACGVGEDELNRVISELKDGGGEFDGRLDEINLNRKAKEWCCVMSKVVEGGRGKKVLIAVVEGRRTTGVKDGTAVGLGYGIPKS